MCACFIIMAEYYTCNSTNEILLSQLCTDRSKETPNAECVFPYDDRTLTFRNVAGAWMILIGILGTLGNSTTLISIPLAVNRKIFGLDENFRSTTIFILHLSFIDLVMSLFGILPLSFQLLTQRWDLGIISCKAYAIFVQIIGPIEASALATIAVTRCIGLINRNNWESFSRKKRNIVLLLITPWFLSFPTLLPYFVKSANVEVGWSCTFGICGTISSCQRSTSPESCYDESTWIDDFIPIYMLVLVLSSIIIITTCYIMINQSAKKSSEPLKKQEHLNKQLKRRDLKMLKTILLLILLHGLCNLPLRGTTFYNFIFPESSLTLSTEYVLLMIYQSQYAMNFFIYAGSNEQYRKAYLYAWRYITLQKNVNETNATNDKELNRIYSTVSSAYRFLRQISTGSKLNHADDS